MMTKEIVYLKFCGINLDLKRFSQLERLHSYLKLLKPSRGGSSFQMVDIYTSLLLITALDARFFFNF